MDTPEPDQPSERKRSRSFATAKLPAEKADAIRASRTDCTLLSTSCSIANS
jgi:hypothetical protein